MTPNPKTLRQLGKPLAIARSAEIYNWEKNRVLKLFRPSICKDAARWEYTNAKEAQAIGVADLNIHEEVLLDDRYGIVMDRIDGGTLTKHIENNPLRVRSYADRFARLHAQMHATKSDALRDVRDVILGYLNVKTMSFLSVEQKKRIADYLKSLPSGNSLLHLDYHTDNVLIAPHCDVPIDWATGAKGDPAADLAMTRFLFNEAELYPGISQFQVFLYSLFRKTIYKRYIKRYLKLTNLKSNALEPRVDEWYLAILIARLVTCEAPSEVKALSVSIQSLAEALPYNDKHAEQDLTSRSKVSDRKEKA